MSLKGYELGGVGLKGYELIRLLGINSTKAAEASGLINITHYGRVHF